MVRPLSVVGVIGLGTAGSALTALLSRAGVHVVAVEDGPAALHRGRDRVLRHLGEPAGGAGDAAGPVTRPGRIDYLIRLDLLPSALDVLVEAVPERLELKAGLLRRAHELCAPQTVFVTTTTGLPVAGLAARSGRATRTVGLHWGEPGASPPVLEVMSAPDTEASALDRVTEMARLLGGTAVTTPDRTGPVGAALVLSLLNDAATMCDDGYAGSADIDTAMMLGCGLPRGPLDRLDLMGVDTVHDSLRALYDRTGDRAFEPAPILARMVAAGRLGRKTGRGFHRYPAAGPPGDDSGPAVAATPGGGSPAVAGRPVRQIGIVGSGTMASGIAEVCARAGFPVALMGRSELRTKNALTAVELSLDRQVRRGRAEPEEVAAVMGRLTGTTGLDAAAGCDLVFEAVAEDLDVKQAVFRELDRVARPGAVLSTTTSSLPVLACATATGRPGDVVGMHFFNPAPVMRLVEVSRTRLTGSDVVATALTVAAALGKRAVACDDRTGFIVNALLLPYLNNAVRMVQDGHAGIDEIDAVMTGGYGMPVGPFALLDMIGLDVSLATQQRLHAVAADPRLAPADLLTELVGAGHLGRKTGRGFRPY